MGHQLTPLNFYNSILGNWKMRDDSLGLSWLVFVAVGCSTVPMMVAVVVFVVVIGVPLRVSVRGLPGDMVIVGKISLATYATLHASEASKVDISDCALKTDTSGFE